MENSKNLPTQLKTNTQICNAAIIIAMERTTCFDLPIEKVSEDVLKAFPDVSIEIIIDAMRRGGLGDFGRTYRLNTQEICIWIKEVLKEIEQKKRPKVAL